VSWLFLVSSDLHPRKTLRDAHEAALAEARRHGISVPPQRGSE
jgi:hypothetical protein